MQRNPSVTRRPVRTPLCSSSALVPTVVPWQKNEISSALTPSTLSASIPSRMARDGSSGVAGSLVIEIAPVSSLKHTKSENVPPVSTVTRYFPNAVLPSRRSRRAGASYALRAFSWSCRRPARGARRKAPGESDMGCRQQAPEIPLPSSTACEGRRRHWGEETWRGEAEHRESKPLERPLHPDLLPATGRTSSGATRTYENAPQSVETW